VTAVTATSVVRRDQPASGSGSSGIAGGDSVTVTRKTP